MLVDDYGRYEAHSQLLANECFPFGDPEGLPVTRQSIDGALQSLVSQNLLIIYEVGDGKYLQLLRWKERVRTPSRFPEPDGSQMTVKCLSNDRQMIASTTSSTPTPAPAPSIPSTSTTSVPVRMDEHDCAVVGGNGSDGHPSFEEVEAFLIPRYQKAGSKSLLWAKNWYGTMLEQGWKDSKGNPIKHWDKNAVAYMDTCWRNDNNAKRH